MEATPSVQISQGTLVGSRQSNGICRFSAIPFAAAPVGALRFKPPVPSRWSGTRDARHAGPVAPQSPSRLAPVTGDFEAPQSEDCLHLTVWTPATDQRRRPVVIWLHGGAWQTGAGALDWYDGAALAAQGDLVVVAPNYRLGVLGWLYVPGELANLGVLDQEAAIEWVVDNIEAFGGDPERITVMGQSAGASCTAILLARQPKFQRAIMQSASLGRGFWPADDAARLGEHILAAAQVDSLDAARQLPCETLLQAQQAPTVLAALRQEASGRSPFSPTHDGDLVPLSLPTLMDQATRHTNVLIGYTLHEMAAFPGHDREASSDQTGDAIFGAPARHWAAQAAAHGRQAWLYRFDFAPSQRYGACHCIELPFLFGTAPSFHDAGMLHQALPADISRLTQDVQRSWIAFIHGRDPWPAYPAMKTFI